MKRINSLLTIGMLSAMLLALPTTTKAASDVLEVTYNNSSSISYAQLAHWVMGLCWDLAITVHTSISAVPFLQPLPLLFQKKLAITDRNTL